MSAKPAVRRSPQQRTSQVHQIRIRTFKLTYELLNLWFHLTQHVFIILNLGYVVDTYPLSIHTCNLCRRYVVVTYRPLIIFSLRKHVFDKCNSGERILFGTAKIWSKRIFKVFLYYYLVPFYINNVSDYFINPPVTLQLFTLTALTSFQ